MPALSVVVLAVAVAATGCGPLQGATVTVASPSSTSATMSPQTTISEQTNPVAADPVLTVPLMRQADPRWMDVPLGGYGPPIGDEGCALTCFAMVASYYGEPTTPAQANETLGEYAYPVEWVAGEPRYGMHIVRKDSIRFRDARLHDADYVRDTVEDCILSGWPVIIGVLQVSTGASHFIVAYGLESEGMENTRILVRDPSGSSDYTHWDDLPEGWMVTRLVVFEK